VLQRPQTLKETLDIWRLVTQAGIVKEILHVLEAEQKA
jgi:hypothetical protein